MYQQILIVFLCPIYLVSSGSYDSLIDLPLTINPGNYIIHATLTELDSGSKFFIQEYISSTSKLTRGKISISSDKIGSIDVHYSTGSNKVQRLVICDNQCDLLTYKNASKWGSKLSGITSQFTSDILLLGPSLVYRLGHLSIAWMQDDDTTIRGIAVESTHAILPDYTYITALYKKNLDPGTGIIQPTRLMLSSTANTFKFTRSSKILLDFYLQTKTSDEVDKIVTPKPGVGCPNYLTDGLAKQYSSVPLIGKNQLHYIAVENVNGPEQTSTRNQFFADEQYGLMYLESISSGITTSQIYDYTLGVIYQRKNSGCSLYSIQLDSPGVDYNGKFSLTELLGTNSYFKYVGQVNYEKRSGFQVDVWESIGYTYKKVAYDKVVTTLYFVKSSDPESVFGYIPVGATVNLYNKKPSGDYSLVESVDKVYYDFGLMNGAEEYRNQFQVADCYPDAENQKTLELHFSCDSPQSCDYFAKQKFYNFRDSVKNALLDTEIISASRISEVDLSFGDNDTIAYVTFLDAPIAKNIFKPEYVYLSKKSLSDAKTTLSFSADKCLNTNAFTADSFEVLAYCDETNTCAKINYYDSIVEDKQNGTSCKVYRFPLRNFYRFSRETPLDKLQTEISRRNVSFKFIGFSSIGAMVSSTYKLSQVVDVTQNQDEVEQLYENKRSESKLVQDDENVLMVANVNDFGDCYRACVNSDDGSCETLSYCQYPDRVECLVSMVNYINISSEKIAYDASCKIYSANHVNDYVKIPFRQFKSTSLLKVNGWTSKCANICFNSDDCKSFQVCSGSCSFTGSYTDSISQYSEMCNIYIPKVSRKFTYTGEKITTETFHTEFKLNLDQCAALCYDWSYNGLNETCVSYNYCPKARSASSCSLSMFSVKDSTTKSTVSDVCHNYQLSDVDSSNDKNNKKQVNGQIEANGTSVATAFGIITLFMAIGLIVGFGAPFVYNKTQSILNTVKLSQSNETFRWTRHVNNDNDNDDQHSVI